MSWIYGIESLNRINIVTDQKVCRPHLVSFLYFMAMKLIVCYFFFGLEK